MPSDQFIVNIDSVELTKIIDEYKKNMKDPAFNTDAKTYIFSRSTRWLTMSDE